MSDEEINKASRKLFDCSPESAYGYAFREGAKWASKDLEKKLAEAKRDYSDLKDLYQDAIGKRMEREDKLAVAKEALEFYGSWKSYGSSKHPFLERYSAEVMLDSSEVEYTEMDGDIFKQTFGGKRAREALRQLSEQ